MGGIFLLKAIWPRCDLIIFKTLKFLTNGYLKFENYGDFWVKNFKIHEQILKFQISSQPGLEL